MTEQQQNTVGLQTYYDARLKAIEQEIHLRAEKADLAISVAREAQEFRLAEMNEFRKAMSDQAGHFVNRNEIDNFRDSVQSEMRALSRQLYLIVGAFGVLQVLVFFLLRG